MKFPRAIVLTRVRAGLEMLSGDIILPTKFQSVEFNAGLFVAAMLSMMDVTVAVQEDEGELSCTEIMFATVNGVRHETINVRESRDEIRQMIEDLPEDEPEQSKPTAEARYLCEECSAEYDVEEIGRVMGAIGEQLAITCPSCRGHLTVAEAPPAYHEGYDPSHPHNVEDAAKPDAWSPENPGHFYRGDDGEKMTKTPTDA